MKVFLNPSPLDVTSEPQYWLKRLLHSWIRNSSTGTPTEFNYITMAASGLRVTCLTVRNSRSERFGLSRVYLFPRTSSPDLILIVWLGERGQPTACEDTAGWYIRIGGQVKLGLCCTLDSVALQNLTCAALEWTVPIRLTVPNVSGSGVICTHSTHAMLSCYCLKPTLWRRGMSWVTDLYCPSYKLFWKANRVWPGSDNRYISKRVLNYHPYTSGYVIVGETMLWCVRLW